jgi:release factor glutamine methyltransferase
LADDAKIWTIEDVLRWATDDFRARGVDSPRLDAELLLGRATGLTRIQLIVEAKQELEASQLTAFRDLVKRRRAREPIAYILGSREFYGHAFRVDARVLVPRPDTEALVETALLRTRHVSLAMRALDLCTGSGCVAVSLALDRPTSLVLATDQSDGALAVARGNALRLGAYRVAFALGDLYAAVPPACRFDVVTANPPYIATGDVPGLMPDVRDFEPRLALVGGVDGLDLVRRVVADAAPFLVPGGVLAVEVGAGQAPAVVTLFERAGYEQVEVRRDYARIERVVSGVLRTP